MNNEIRDSQGIGPSSSARCPSHTKTEDGSAHTPPTNASVACAIYYAVVLSALASVISSIDFNICIEALLEGRWMSLVGRLPNVIFTAATLSFYTKIFVDDMKTGASDGALLKYNACAWLFFVIQVSMLKCFFASLLAFTVGMIFLTYGMLKYESDNRQEITENIFIIVGSLILLFLVVGQLLCPMF